MRKRVVSPNAGDGKADLPTNAKLRVFRARDPQSLSQADRRAYANAVHAAIRSDNQRRGQSYKPKWSSLGACQSAYDQHMKEQRARQPEPINIIKPATPIITESALIAEPIVFKPSILPALLAQHFDVGARKLATQLIANVQRELTNREADIAVAVTNFCIELGI